MRADDAVVPASEVRRLEERVRELEPLSGRQTMLDGVNTRPIMAQQSLMPALKICPGGMGQLYAFARLICCRARNTVRSPAFTSADTVHNRQAKLRGSMRRADQKVSSPIRCCLAWQALHRGTA